MTDLKSLITQTLGVVQPAPVMPFNRVPVKKVLARPAAEYQYEVRYTRTEYGSAIVTAENQDAAWNDDDPDIDWHGSDDKAEPDSVTLHKKSICNQDDIDDWDETFGDHYDHDGDPMCTRCCEYNAPSKPPLEHSDADEGYGWYCQQCLSEL